MPSFWRCMKLNAFEERFASASPSFLVVYLRLLKAFLFILVWRSTPVQTGPRVHPASYTMSTGPFTGVKRPGRVVDHPPPSSAEVKEIVELYLYSPSGPSWPDIGWNLPLSFTFMEVYTRMFLINQFLVVSAQYNPARCMIAVCFLRNDPLSTQLSYHR